MINKSKPMNQYKSGDLVIWYHFGQFNLRTIVKVLSLVNWTMCSI